LGLAWQVLNGAAGSPAVLNAANEVAVAAFLDKRIRFDQIHHVNVQTLASVVPHEPASLGDLLALDAESRSVASSVVSQLAV
jgi:1-deoxy-D-xylulose-5-phosphate reductoisomerase